MNDALAATVKGGDITRTPRHRSVSFHILPSEVRGEARRGIEELFQRPVSKLTHAQSSKTYMDVASGNGKWQPIKSKRNVQHL